MFVHCLYDRISIWYNNLNGKGPHSVYRTLWSQWQFMFINSYFIQQWCLTSSGITSNQIMNKYKIINYHSEINKYDPLTDTVYGMLTQNDYNSSCFIVFSIPQNENFCYARVALWWQMKRMSTHSYRWNGQPWPGRQDQRGDLICPASPR